MRLCRIGSVFSVSASHTVGCEFASRVGHTKDHHKNGTNCLPAGVWHCSRTVSKGRVVCGTVYKGHALKRSPGINSKSRVLYPGLGFLSSATWPSLPKKHYNGLNHTKPERTSRIGGAVMQGESRVVKSHVNACRDIMRLNILF